MNNIENQFRSGLPDSLKWQTPPLGALPFDLADMDIPTMPEVVDAVVSRASQGQFGYARVPEALQIVTVDRLKLLYDWDVRPDWIVWLPGTVAGLRTTIQAVCQKNRDEVVAFTPTYEPFLALPKSFRRKLSVVPLKENDWRIDFEELEKVIGSRTKLLLLCRPHNPTGAMWKEADIRRLTALCKEFDVVICSDEIHAELILDTDEVHTPTAVIDPNALVITLFSASKTFNLAGLGCGFAVIPDATLRSAFDAVRQQFSPAVTLFGYTGTLAAFTHGEPWKQSLLAHLRENQNLVHDFCRAHGMAYHPAPATYLAWIDIRKVRSADSFRQRCQSHGIKIYTGESFGYEGFIRFNFACSRDQLVSGFESMHQVLMSSG